MPVVRVPLTVRARARVRIIERLARAEAEAATAGPFVVLPPMDPLPIPPADDALLETTVPVASTKVSGDGLRALWAEWKAGTLT